MVAPKGLDDLSNSRFGIRCVERSEAVSIRILLVPCM